MEWMSGNKYNERFSGEVTWGGETKWGKRMDYIEKEYKKTTHHCIMFWVLEDILRGAYNSHFSIDAIHGLINSG